MTRGRKQQTVAHVADALSHLGREMRALRQAHGLSVKQLAAQVPWSEPHLSRVELGKVCPSEELVEWYETLFLADGLLLSLYGDVLYEQRRKKRRGRSPFTIGGVVLSDPDPETDVSRIPGDRCNFIGDITIPDGTIMKPGAKFVKIWEVVNAGSVPWRGRYYSREGPCTGPAAITSPPRARIPDAEPGESIRIEISMQAPRMESTAVARFKQTDAAGNLYYPRTYTVGLTVQVTTRREHSKAAP